MKEFKGTPGEWVNVGGWVDAEDNGIICSLSAVDLKGEIESDANAQIISASKNMLEALLYQRRHQDGDARCDLQTYLHLRDAAIAKALGEDHE